jgi:hypothetical protein
LGKAALQHGVGRVQLQVFFLDNFPDGLHGCRNYPINAGISPNVDNQGFDIAIWVFRGVAGDGILSRP